MLWSASASPSAGSPRGVGNRDELPESTTCHHDLAIGTPLAELALAMRLLSTSWILCVGLGLSLGLAACGTDSSDDGPESPPTVAQSTWYQDVGPIMSKHCMSCHQEGGAAPFPLTDAGSARDNAPRAIDKIDQGVMPPFDAREESSCTPRFNWVDD